MGDLRVSFPKPCSERWDDMRPDGCNRFCEQCEKTIHDLSKLTLEEAEDLARSGREICVRARVGSDGVVKLRRSEPGNARRMVASIGASVGILVASAQAAAAEEPRFGAIKGEVLGSCGGIIVSATAADGRTYRAKVGPNGRYKVKRLPAGRYQVTTEVGPEAPKASEVIVEAGRTVKLDLKDPLNYCIIVGRLEIEENQA